MSSGKKSDSNFLVQGSILAIASIVSRIIGLLYRIPMTNIIGDTGNSYYSAAFEIYNILLIISAIGGIQAGICPCLEGAKKKCISNCKRGPAFSNRYRTYCKFDSFLWCVILHKHAEYAP